MTTLSSLWTKVSCRSNKKIIEAEGIHFLFSQPFSFSLAPWVSVSVSLGILSALGRFSNIIPCLQRAFYSSQHSGPPETWFSRKLKGIWPSTMILATSLVLSALLSTHTGLLEHTEPAPPQGLCSRTLPEDNWLTSSIVCSDFTFSIEPTLTTLLHLANVPSSCLTASQNQHPNPPKPFPHLLFFYSIYHLLIHYIIYFLFACIVWYLTLSFWNINSMIVWIVFVLGFFPLISVLQGSRAEGGTEKMVNK